MGWVGGVLGGAREKASAIIGNDVCDCLALVSLCYWIAFPWTT